MTVTVYIQAPLPKRATERLARPHPHHQRFPPSPAIFARQLLRSLP